jgi:putative ABC transport system substrate-binding protein
LRRGLSDLGYIDGENLIIDFALARTADELPEVAKTLVQRDVDLIVASGAASVLPAKEASGSIPVVFVAGIDPIATGLAVKGLSKPGANLTGLTTIQIDLTAKRMQLLKEMLPSTTLLAFLSRETNPGNGEYIREAERAAKSLRIELFVISAREPADFEKVFQDAAGRGAGALVPMDDAVFTSARGKLVELSARYRLPGVYPIREFVVAGGLMSLGPRYQDVYRRAATFVDKILKGTPPVELPIEQPTTFEIVINQRTAKQLAITVPPPLLARADEIIE